MKLKSNIRLLLLTISVIIALLACPTNVSAEVLTIQQENLNSNSSLNNILMKTELTPTMYKQDYLQACKIIANKYIYLEQQLGITREEFYEQSVKYADSVDWTTGKFRFVLEIRKLRSNFADGHFDWCLDEQLYINDANYSLGFVMTIGNDGHVYVGKVYDGFSCDLTTGDEILTWNDITIQEAITQFSSIIPQSTKLASHEVAARMLSIELQERPLRDILQPVRLSYKKANGQVSATRLQWKKANLSTKAFGQNSSSDKILFTKNDIPSLEDIPDDCQYINPNLLYYFRNIDGKTIAVLHPRVMFNWTSKDLDQTFARICEQNPDTLLIDLFDCAGGQFEYLIYLANILNIKQDLRCYVCYIEEMDNKPSTKNIQLINLIDNNNIANNLAFNHVWFGKTILRINPICGSVCDYFSRWFQINTRGKIIGLPTAGRGGGTDSFTLNNTKTKIDIPLHDWRLENDTQSFEGHSVIPNYMTYEKMDILINRIANGEI